MSNLKVPRQDGAGPPKPKPGKPALFLPTQDLTDDVYIEEVTKNVPGFQPPTPLSAHPKSPAHKLAKMEFFQAGDQKILVRQIYTKFPGKLLTGGVVNSSTLGSKGILTRQRVATGTDPEEGFDVIDSTVEPEDAVTANRTTLKVAEWPILVGSEYDERTGNMIDIEKRFVPAGTVGSISGGVVKEVQPLDKWKSIQIQSRINLITGSRTKDIKYRYSFPNELVNAFYITAWGSSGSKFAWDVGLHLDIHYGYEGPCDATLHEHYVTDPASVTIPNITKFFPQGHMVSLWYASGTPSAVVRSFTVPESLHPMIDLTGTGTGSGNTASDTIPATTPTALPHGATICVDTPDPESYRGIWIVRYVTLLVP